jgi:hypothetical protein
LRAFLIPVLTGFALALETTRRKPTAMPSAFLFLVNGLFGSPPFSKPGEPDLEIQTEWVRKRIRWEGPLARVLAWDVTVDIRNIGGRRASAIFTVTSSLITGVVVEIISRATLGRLVAINHGRAGTATTTATAILRN